MNSLYTTVLNFLSNIMQHDAALSSAAQLIAICVTLLVTYFIVLYPLKIVLDLIFRRKATK